MPQAAAMKCGARGRPAGSAPLPVAAVGHHPIETHAVGPLCAMASHRRLARASVFLVTGT